MGTRWVALAAVALAVIAMGCGGGDDEDGSDGGEATASAPLSKSEYIKQVDAVCAKGGKESEAEFTRFVKSKAIAKGQQLNADQIAEVGSDILVPALKKQADQIAALEPPPADVDQIDEYFTGIDAAIRELEENPEEAKFTAKLFADTDKIAQKYGFKVCGNR